MAYIWQRWMADEYRKAGLKVVEVSGWKNRGRPASTGNFDPRGAKTNHHTGTKTSATNKAPTLRTVIEGRSDLPGPLAQKVIGYDGTVYVVAAGRCNHAGKVGKRGVTGMPYGADGNALALGDEVDTNGTQVLNKEQRAALAKVNAVDLMHFDRGTSYAHRHQDISGTGKWDIGSLTTAQVRSDAAAAIKALSTPPPPPVTTHTRWAIHTTGVHSSPGGPKLRDIPAGYKFQVIDGSGHGNDGWIETAAGNWVLGADTTTRDPALPSTLSVFSWNVKAGAARVDTVLAELKAMTAAEKPDVVCLQECYNLPRFGDAFPGYSFSYQAAGEAKTDGYVSEYPANVMLVRDGAGEVKVQAPLEMSETWKGPKVGAMHDPRIHHRLTILKDGVIWRVINMHVPPPISGGGNNDAIAESNAAMVECLTEFPADEPVIIVGDMNQTNGVVVTRVGAPGGAVVDGGGVDLAIYRDCKKTAGENLGLHTSDHPAKKWTFEA